MHVACHVAEPELHSLLILHKPPIAGEISDCLFVSGHTLVTRLGTREDPLGPGIGEQI